MFDDLISKLICQDNVFFYEIEIDYFFFRGQVKSESSVFCCSQVEIFVDLDFEFEICCALD